MEAPADSGAPARAPGAASRAAMIVLAVLGLLISGYLTAASLFTDKGPIGCGDDSGCAAVLASKWSAVFGVPVSAAATLTYLVLLGALVLRAWPLTALLGGLIGGAAVYFIALQFFVVQAVCPWCMADHIVGLILVGFIAAATPGPARRRSIAPAAVGVLAIAAMAGVQAASSEPTYRLAIPTGQDYDLTDDRGRLLGLLNGQLQLNLNDAPVAGPRDAPDVAVILFDYACPHCRAMLKTLHAYRMEHPGRFAKVSLPMPLNHQCNPYRAPEQFHQRFAHSCDLAWLSVAVYYAAPDQWEAFDRFLWDTDRVRTKEEAEAEALRRVDADRLQEALLDPRINALVASGTQAWHAVGEPVLPVIMAPGAPAIEGKTDDFTQIDALFTEKPQSRESHP